LAVEISIPINTRKKIVLKNKLGERCMKLSVNSMCLIEEKVN
jgi:hypothetical protein